MSQIAVDFIKRLFGATTEQPVYVCSLANEKNDPSEPNERHIATREPDDITAFIGKWDRSGRGLFFCPSTVKGGMKREKASVAEISGLWSDIDFKDVLEDPKTILHRLQTQLRFPPSLIVESGNGYHCYWPFKEAMIVNIVDGEDTIERIEAALKLLADMVGGDMKVTQIAALMRMPGTHNSKRGEWKDVVIVHQSANTYELDDLEEMMAEISPIVLRKLRPSPTVDEINPYMRVATMFGFKPPLDVEKRLSTMLYMGGEEVSIHGTQVSVTASLLNAGVEVEEIVKTVLEATRSAAGDYGARWNWRREETAIRKMCATWQKKHPVETKSAPKLVSNGNSATVHKLDDVRPKKEPPPKSQKVIDRENMHVMIGSTILKRMQDEGTPIMIVGDQLWRYDDGIWTEATNKGRNVLDVEIESCIRALGSVTSSLKLVAEVRGWFFRNPDIHHDEIEWDDHGKIAVKSGLIDPKTFAFEAAQPSHHVTARIDCKYDPAAACPMWLAMLETTFADRPDQHRADTIGLIQELLGAALIEEKSKALSRALVFHGPSNTGKTDLIKTISGLLTDNPISTPFAALDNAHGMMEFTRRAPWVLHEAFEAGKWHFTSNVKSILSGDPVQINIKNGAITTRRIRQPVFWGTNFPPQFKEATRAIINRMIVVNCLTVFDPKDPVGIALDARQRGFSEPSDMILTLEKPGLLNWALAGLRRALNRGYFRTTLEVDETLEAVRTDSNIVAGFLDDCVSFGPDYMISTSDFCAAFAVWWGETKGDDRHTPSNESIGRALAAYGDPRIGIDAKALKDNKHRYYAGVWLNGVGLDYWAGASAEGMAKGKTARTSSNQNDVNRTIPPSWETREAVLKIKRASVTVAVTVGDSSQELPPKGDRSPKF